MAAAAENSNKNPSNKRITPSARLVLSDPTARRKSALWNAPAGYPLNPKNSQGIPHTPCPGAKEWALAGCRRLSAWAMAAVARGESNRIGLASAMGWQRVAKHPGAASAGHGPVDQARSRDGDKSLKTVATGVVVEGPQAGCQDQ